MELYLIRHTTPDVAKGICYGQKNIGLTEAFLEELKRLEAKLPEEHKMFQVYSSPLKRCSKLATKLSEQGIITDDRLMELNFGSWEGQKWDDINEEELSEWMQDFVEVECPGGESYRRLYDRVTAWWKEVIRSKQEKVLVVTHAGVIRCLLSHILGLPLENSFRLQVGYGSVSQIVYQNNRNTVAFINR
ncbi:MAG TPA: alpha-ribazole phosphatase [Fodinibius sp.]|nr:alpha-ribazole phosphatase [Fodinibius sp.]